MRASTDRSCLAWLIGGVVLLIAEVIAPGFFLVFVGAAALATGLFTLLFGLGTVPQLALFALYALLAVMIGRRFYANRHSLSADPLLNDRPAASRKNRDGRRRRGRPQRPRSPW